MNGAVTLAVLAESPHLPAAQLVVTVLLATLLLAREMLRAAGTQAAATWTRRLAAVSLPLMILFGQLVASNIVEFLT